MINRALHFVLKIGNLRKNVEFFRDKLGMTVLRHEVFEEGCEAACNGPYSGKWSKTMIGYGPEDDNFVLELTYNYSIGKYSLGNDLQYIKIDLVEERFNRLKTSTTEKEESFSLYSPDGYKFIINKLSSNNKKRDDITEVCLSSQDLQKSINYWSSLLGMKQHICDQSRNDELVLKYGDSQACLKLKQIEEKIDHKSAYGRIAFSCPTSNLKSLQKKVEEAQGKVLTPYLSLETPGKATVYVVILADPDGHEICFVGDEGFRELSQVDPKADELIEKSIKEDKSDEWFEKKNLKKMES